ncbi:MAG: PTS sugar transporter subunit IIA [Deltaproteobacteria bacterium]|nr:PTS sugar transporter subunit IIA [Deltaproteobacteria bacterium]
MIAPDLCLPRLSAKTAEEVIRALARRLAEKGHVRPTFEQAALSREKRSPTGLPFPGVAVALPHAEPEHVATPAIAAATLVAPVVFRQMGSPAIKLSVSVVVMPAFSAKEQAGAGLSELIDRLQDEALRARLVSASTAEEIADLLRST